MGEAAGGEERRQHRGGGGATGHAEGRPVGGLGQERQEGRVSGLRFGLGASAGT